MEYLNAQRGLFCIMTQKIWLWLIRHALLMAHNFAYDHDFHYYCLLLIQFDEQATSRKFGMNQRINKSWYDFQSAGIEKPIYKILLDIVLVQF